MTFRLTGKSRRPGSTLRQGSGQKKSRALRPALLSDHENRRLIAAPPAASAGSAGTTTATPATPLLSTGSTRTTWSGRPTLAGCRDRHAIGAVVVDFLSLFHRGAVIVVEVFAAFDHDGAGIRRWLPLFRRSRPWRTRCSRRRCFRRSHIASGTTTRPTRIRLRQSQLLPLFLQYGLARQLDSVAFDAKHLHHHLIALVQLVLHFASRDARRSR